MTSSVHVDLSWDAELCNSYNPEEYVLNHLIFKRPPTNLSKSAKKLFRQEERERFRNLQLIEEREKQRLLEFINFVRRNQHKAPKTPVDYSWD